MSFFSFSDCVDAEASVFHDDDDLWALIDQDTMSSTGGRACFAAIAAAEGSDRASSCASAASAAGASARASAGSLADPFHMAHDTFDVEDLTGPCMRSISLAECVPTGCMDSVSFRSCDIASTDASFQGLQSTKSAAASSSHHDRLTVAPHTANSKVEPKHMPPTIPEFWSMSRSNTSYAYPEHALDATVAAIQRTSSAEPRWVCDVEVRRNEHKAVGIFYNGFSKIDFCVHVFTHPASGDAIIEFQRLSGPVIDWHYFYKSCLATLHGDDHKTSMSQAKGSAPIFLTSMLPEHEVKSQLSYMRERLTANCVPGMRVQTIKEVASLVHSQADHGAPVRDAALKAVAQSGVLEELCSMLVSSAPEVASAAAVALDGMHRIMGSCPHLDLWKWDDVLTHVLKALEEARPCLSNVHMRRLCVHILHGLSCQHPQVLQRMDGVRVLAQVGPTLPKRAASLAQQTVQRLRAAIPCA